MDTSKTQISSQLRRCEEIFLLTYTPYAALRKFLRALHLGELWIFRGIHKCYPNKYKPKSIAS